MTFYARKALSLVLVLLVLNLPFSAAASELELDAPSQRETLGVSVDDSTLGPLEQRIVGDPADRSLSDELMKIDTSSEFVDFSSNSTAEPQAEDPRPNSPLRVFSPAQINLSATPDPQVREWIASVENGDLRYVEAFSPSMERIVRLLWFSPSSGESLRLPTLYAIPGRFGGAHGEMLFNTGLLEMAEKGNVNLVTPLDGAFTSYTDWLEPVPPLGGRQLWETFLTKELPETLESAIDADGRRAILGVSSSGASVLNFAIHNPGMYSSVGIFSGCMETNNSWSRIVIDRTNQPGGGSVENMWGESGSAWARYNDPFINAEELRRQNNIFIYSGTGLLGSQDFKGMNQIQDDILLDRMIVGGLIEGGANWCSHRMRARTESLGIDSVSYAFGQSGTHSWGYWGEALGEFWTYMVHGFSSYDGFS